MAKKVTLPRQLYYANPFFRGNDVFAVQRALHKAGLYNRPGGEYTHEYGPVTRDGVHIYQSRHNLAVGWFGQGTLDSMVQAGLIDGYGEWLFEHFDPPDTNVRQRICEGAWLMLANRYATHYAAGVTVNHRWDAILERVRPPRFPIFADCSSAVTWDYWQAGAPDPNRLNYAPGGWTGTLESEGKQIPLSKAKLADLVFYQNPDHVAIVVSTGSTPTVISDGSESSPYHLPADYRSIYQVRTYPVT